MKLRSLLVAASLIAVMIASDQSVSASSQRVRTVPKEAKDQKKSEPKASAPKQLTTSTASLISPRESENNFTARNCSQSKTDRCDILLAEGGVPK